MGHGLPACARCPFRQRGFPWNSSMESTTCVSSLVNIVTRVSVECFLSALARSSRVNRPISCHWPTVRAHVGTCSCPADGHPLVRKAPGRYEAPFPSLLWPSEWGGVGRGEVWKGIGLPESEARTDYLTVTLRRTA